MGVPCFVVLARFLFRLYIVLSSVRISDCSMRLMCVSCFVVGFRFVCSVFYLGFAHIVILALLSSVRISDSSIRSILLWSSNLSGLYRIAILILSLDGFCWTWKLCFIFSELCFY